MKHDIHHITFDSVEFKEIIEALYNCSIFLNEERPIYRENGTQGSWGLDFRRPLCMGRYLSAISNIFAHKIRDMGIKQVVGTGCAGTLLIGGILSSSPDFSGGIIRSTRKTYGFREIIEGSLDKDKSIVLVDDILSSGSTLIKALDILNQDGYVVEAAIPLMAFGWRKGIRVLQEKGLLVQPLSVLDYITNPKQLDVKVSWQCKNMNNVRWL